MKGWKEYQERSSFDSEIDVHRTCIGFVMPVLLVGSETVINFPWIFYAIPCWELSEYIWVLLHLACLQVFSVTPWVIVHRLYRVR